MLDTFEIRLYSPDDTTYDAANDETTNTYEVLFTTPGRLKTSGVVGVRETEVGGRTSGLSVRTLSIPVASPFVPPLAVAVCTAVHATTDPTLLGATLTLDGPAPGSQMTARRLQVSEVLT